MWWLYNSQTAASVGCSQSAFSEYIKSSPRKVQWRVGDGFIDVRGVWSKGQTSVTQNKKLMLVLMGDISSTNGSCKGKDQLRCPCWPLSTTKQWAGEHQNWTTTQWKKESRQHIITFVFPWPPRPPILNPVKHLLMYWKCGPWRPYLIASTSQRISRWHLGARHRSAPSGVF